MKVTGIIVEYNPLHNGHLHHIEETKRLSKCDCLIAVMSGNFVQRGEPAIFDKFTRTKMALLNHVDLVIELPFVFSVQSAELFSKASIEMLSLLGVDDVYFGSESASITELSEILDVLESKEYDTILKENLAQGYSYPTSSDNAMKILLPNNQYNKPNNILGIHYLKAKRDIKSPIQLHTIPRIKVDYYAELDTNKSIQSATAIRKELLNGNDISRYVPLNIMELIKNKKPVDLNDFVNEFAYILKSKTKEDLHSIHLVEEGLENRLLKQSNFSSVDELISKIISKRYTNSKLKRMLIHILCNVKKLELQNQSVPYIRILGMNDKGKAYLSSIKKDFTPPIISKVKEGIHPYLDIELRASKIYSLVSDVDVFKEEFKPLIYKRID